MFRVSVIRYDIFWLNTVCLYDIYWPNYVGLYDTGTSSLYDMYGPDSVFRYDIYCDSYWRVYWWRGDQYLSFVVTNCYYLQIIVYNTIFLIFIPCLWSFCQWMSYKTPESGQHIHTVQTNTSWFVFIYENSQTLF
jgi:hypothetical protein